MILSTAYWKKMPIRIELRVGFIAGLIEKHPEGTLDTRFSSLDNEKYLQSYRELLTSLGK